MGVQISARVSEATKELLEHECRVTGVKKEFLIEEALLYHLRALQELPPDVLIRPRSAISVDTAESLLARMASPKPTPALIALMKPNGHSSASRE